MSIWVTSSLQKFQDKIKEGKPNVQGNFTFRRGANGTETPLSEDEMKDKDRRLRAAINAFTDSTGKPTKIGQQILDTPLHAGSVIITEGTDQVNNVINQMAGENATEAEREIIIAGALAKGLFRINKDGVLQVVAGKVAALDSVKQVGAQSLDMLERINAVNYGLQGVQEVVLGAARVYGAVASIATAPVTTLVGASAGMVSRAFYEEQYNNRQATLGQLAQSAELGSAVANVGVAAVNLARVAARAVSIGDDIIQLGIAGGPKPNVPSAAATGANVPGIANGIDDVSSGLIPKPPSSGGFGNGPGGSIPPQKLLPSAPDGVPLDNHEIVVYASTPSANSFKLRPGVDDLPIRNLMKPGEFSVTTPGKSVSIATDLTVPGEYRQMFGVDRVSKLHRGDTLSGAFVEDIRAAGFDVVYAPTANNYLHARIVPAANSFDDAGREYLSVAFDRIGRVK